LKSVSAGVVDSTTPAIVDATVLRPLQYLCVYYKIL